MLIVPRSEWQEPGREVTGPVCQLGYVGSITWHWPGSDVGPTATRADKIAHLRKAQRSYLTSRGYSYGYSWVIFGDGEVWEVRGDTIQCAANGSESWNEHSLATQFCSADTTPAQVASARALVAWLTKRTDRPQLSQWGHRDVRSQVWPSIAQPGRWSTQCPGDAIYVRIGRGEFVPQPLPPPVVVPPEEDAVQVRYRDRRYLNIWLIGAAPALNLSGELDAYLVSKGIELVEGEHDQMLAGLLMQSGLSRADLVPA